MGDIAISVGIAAAITIVAIYIYADYIVPLQMPATAPPGTVINYAGNTPPPGYLVCNGAAVSRVMYTHGGPI